MSQLLVSVRSASEAAIAVAGGVQLIDVKEPANGALGRADDTVIDSVVRAIGGRAPVSAAFGELVECAEPSTVRGLSYAKWGLAGVRPASRVSGSAWSDLLDRVAARLQLLTPNCQLVTAAYADWRMAHAPPPDDVCDVACDRRRGPFLLDTFQKNGASLLDHLSVADIESLCRRCRDAGVPVALAGALGAEQIGRLRGLEPDWFAVRGAVCRRGERGATIDIRRVRRLAAMLRAAIPTS